MLEVEMKFPVADAARVGEHLQKLGIPVHEVRTEVDRYWNAPDRDFARTDEALRIRSVGARNVLTYKGPKIDPQTKTRTEIEVTLAPGRAAADKATEMFKRLGYRAVAVMRKERTVYKMTARGFSVEICLDRVEGLGTYVELETVTPEEQLAAARVAVQELAAKLGLSQSERRSYLELWLEKHKV